MIKISLSSTLCSAALTKRLQKTSMTSIAILSESYHQIAKRHIKSSCRKLMMLCRLLCFTLWWSDWLSRVWAEWLQALQLQFFTYLQRPIIFLTWKFLMSIATARAVTACLPQKISSCVDDERWFTDETNWCRFDDKLVRCWCESCMYITQQLPYKSTKIVPYKNTNTSLILARWYESYLNPHATSGDDTSAISLLKHLSTSFVSAKT